MKLRTLFIQEYGRTAFYNLSKRLRDLIRKIDAGPLNDLPTVEERARVSKRWQGKQWNSRDLFKRKNKWGVS